METPAGAGVGVVASSPHRHARSVDPDGFVVPIAEVYLFHVPRLVRVFDVPSEPGARPHAHRIEGRTAPTARVLADHRAPKKPREPRGLGVEPHTNALPPQVSVDPGEGGEHHRRRAGETGLPAERAELTATGVFEILLRPDAEVRHVDAAQLCAVGITAEDFEGDPMRAKLVVGEDREIPHRSLRRGRS